MSISSEDLSRLLPDHVGQIIQSIVAQAMIVGMKSRGETTASMGKYVDEISEKGSLEIIKHFNIYKQKWIEEHININNFF